MSLEHIILGFLHFKPQTGYELKKYIDVSTRFMTHTTLSRIYPMLKRLDDKKCVSFETRTQEGKPDSKVYSLTPLGEDEFRRWLEEPAKLDLHSFNNFKLKFFFSGFLSKDILISRISRELEFRKKQLAESDSQEIVPPADMVDSKYICVDEATRYWELTHMMGNKHLRSYVEWLEYIYAETELQISRPLS